MWIASGIAATVYLMGTIKQHQGNTVDHNQAGVVLYKQAPHFQGSPLGEVQIYLFW